MQPSGTAKDVPARRNRLLGIKTRLNLDLNHAGPMREKTKASWEHFYNYYLFTISEEKHVAQQKVYWGCNARKDERGVGCDDYTSNLQTQTQCRLDARLIKAITITTMKILYRLI